MARYLAADERNHVADDVVDVQPCWLGFGLRRELADPLDHVGRPVTVLHDGGQRVADHLARFGLYVSSNGSVPASSSTRIPMILSAGSLQRRSKTALTR